MIVHFLEMVKVEEVQVRYGRRKLAASRRCSRYVLVAGLIALVHLASPAQAQLIDQLKNAVNPGQGGNNTGSGLPGGLDGGTIPSVGQASPSNTAGVLQYCIQNNYVGDGSASSVKNSLMSKVTGSRQDTNDSGFKSGSSGLLQTGNGQNFSLGGDGIKAQITRKVCDQILQRAKSLL